MKRWGNCFAVSGQRCISGFWLLRFKVVAVKIVKQMLYVDFISLICNLVHVSLHIILLFSVNEVVEMKMQGLSLCPHCFCRLGRKTPKVRLAVVTEANKKYKTQSF